MAPRAFVVLTVFSLVTVGCKGKSDRPAEQAQEAQAAPASPEPSETPAPSPPAGKTPEEEAKAAALDRADPDWFRPSIWPGAKVESSGRSEPDTRNLFASQFLLSLPPGTTIPQCVEHFQKQLEEHMPNLREETVGKGGDDRITLRGSTDAYHATIICGEAKDAVKAYVSYQWTKAPPSGSLEVR